MARATNADIVVFGIGATDYLPWLVSADFNWDVTLESCEGINERYQRVAVETKRTLTFSANMKRRVNAAGACQTNKTVTTLTIGGVSFLSDWESIRIGYQNANSRSDGGGAYLAQVQLHKPTTVSVTINLMANQTTATWLETLADSATATQATVSYIDAVGTVTVSSYIRTVRKSWPEGGICMVEITLEMGEITSGGGGLFATGATGTGAITFTASDGGDAIEGTAVILSGELQITRDQRSSESYQFHVNTVTASA